MDGDGVVKLEDLVFSSQILASKEPNLDADVDGDRRVGPCY